MASVLSLPIILKQLNNFSLASVSVSCHMTVEGAVFLLVFHSDFVCARRVEIFCTHTEPLPAAFMPHSSFVRTFVYVSASLVPSETFGHLLFP